MNYVDPWGMNTSNSTNTFDTGSYLVGYNNGVLHDLNGSITGEIGLESTIGPFEALGTAAAVIKIGFSVGKIAVNGLMKSYGDDIVASLPITRASKSARFPSDPNKLFPENYPGMTKTVKLDGKIVYEVEAGGKKYKVEYHPEHGGTEHYPGDHYHVKKQSDYPPPGKTKPIYFRIPNKDPHTPATPGGGTFSPGDLLPTENR
nr:hypothetical protein [uncultured Desulfobulbus sp.]